MTTGRHSPAGRPSENTIAGTVYGVSLQAHTINGNVMISPPRTVTPAQLRAASPFFTNRRQELAELTELGPVDSGPPRLVVISGVGGCGKTALVLHWAHSVLSRFADGQFFVDLRGFSGDRSGPLSRARYWSASFGQWGSTPTGPTADGCVAARSVTRLRSPGEIRRSRRACSKGSAPPTTASRTGSPRSSISASAGIGPDSGSEHLTDRRNDDEV